jgi:hypothetical protein
MNTHYDKLAEGFLYDLWYEYATALVDRVIEVCALSPEKAELLKQIYLRPNDFLVEIM